MWSLGDRLVFFVFTVFLCSGIADFTPNSSDLARVDERSRQLQFSDASNVTFFVNSSDAWRCRMPRPCTNFSDTTGNCWFLPHRSIFDISLGALVCGSMLIANEGDPLYTVTTGAATTRCIPEWKGDGRCDLPNNHNNEQCQYDGGDCCHATCQEHCQDLPDRYNRESSVCSYFCGESVSYLCIDEDSWYSSINSWCMEGDIQRPSQCYFTKLDVVSALQECILSSNAHGNGANAAPQCGNRTLSCTESDVISQNGCHLPKDDCYARPCCEAAIEAGFIQENPDVLPTLEQLYQICENSFTEDDEPCFKFMVKCLQDNRAGKGGCCQCRTGWSGWRCRDPLCWPKCVYGQCVAPNLCHCDEGWQGASCNHALCNPECVPGQGTCVLPNVCECFYGWTGTLCEKPMSTPDCVNGDAVQPDLCRCADGWGGRICDYPLCQSWETPSADCGHGSCVQPYQCECEPGWELYHPINETGYDLPFFWTVGRDVSLATSGTYVIGDSRMNHLSYWDRIYTADSAMSCVVPVCSLVFDPRCTRCARTHCTLCEPGFVVHAPTGRCERCSLIFPNCQLCGPLPHPTDPSANLAEIRCLHCDPLYVLYQGKCVSEGIIEFGSAVYHVYKNQINISVEVIRNPFILEPMSATPLEVLVRTRDGTARSRSLKFGGSLASYQHVAERLMFGVNESISLPESGPEDEAYEAALYDRIESRKEIVIRVYNDVSYHDEVRYFDVDLVLPPEYMAGHHGPLRPFLSTRDHEDNPLLDRQDVLASTRVYIWDLEVSTAENSTAEGGVDLWRSLTRVGQLYSVLIYPRKHDGDLSATVDDVFMVIYKPTSLGMEFALGTPKMASQLPDSVIEGYFLPEEPGPFQVRVERTVPGVHSQYWWSGYAHHNPPRQPDIFRVDPVLDFHWDSPQHAPAFARWQFLLHFQCLRDRGYPAGITNFPHSLGVVASPGVTIALYFWNDGLVEKKTVPADSGPASLENIHSCGGQAALDFFLCVDLLPRMDPVDGPFGHYPFMLEFTAPRPSPRGGPVFVKIVQYENSPGDPAWSFRPVQNGCLYTLGFNIKGSPYEGFSAT